jgi:Flp pilus assembly protein TadD
MIAPGTISEKSQASPVRPTFRIDPPAVNPFVAAPPVSLTQRDNQLDFGLADAAPRQAGPGQGSQILADITSRSRREADVRPLSARTHANLGLALLGESRFDEAAGEFEIALRLQPQHYVAAINFARVKVAKGEYGDAEQLYRDLLQTYPNNPALLMSLAYLMMRRKDFSEAAILLTRVTSLHKNALLPKYHLAIALLAEGKPSEAIRHLRAAVRLDVRSAALYHAMGVAYILAGEPRRAVRYFKSALNLSPEMGESVHALARILLQKGDLEAATEFLRDYLEGNPEDFTAREILARVYVASNRHTFARSQLLRVWKQSGNDQATKAFRAGLANNIGASFDHDGNKEEARHWFVRSLELSADFSPIPYQNLARLYAQEKQIGTALAVLNQCKERFPDDGDTSILIGLVLFEQERYREAATELERLILTRKAGPKAYSYLGGLLCDFLRDTDDALRVLREGKELFPRDRVIVNNLAYVLLMRGDVHSARAVLGSMPQKGLASRPEDEVALTATWGLLRLLEGDTKEAEKLYQEAEALAAQLGKKELAPKVRQKKNLELARAHAQVGDIQAAYRRVQQGLMIEDGNKSYRKDLQDLEKSLKDRMTQPDA